MQNISNVWKSSLKSNHLNLAFTIFILSAVFYLGCSDSSGNSNQQKNKLIPAVEAVKTGYGALPLVERLSGVVRAKNQVDIYPEISAIVSEVHVHNGDKVKRGDRLVTLRQKEFIERLNQAKAALQIAEAQAKQAEARHNELQQSLKRYESLSDKGLTSDAEFETIKSDALSAQADYELSKARVEQAKANVAEVDENLAKTVVRSPVSGMVGNRKAEIGMTVGNSTRLFTVGQLDTVVVEVILTDRMLNYIETGQRSDVISTNIPSGSLSATLSRISPFLHPVTHSTEAEIELPNPDNYLKSGMFTSVDIHYGESENATLVPLSALHENPLSGETGVYVSRDTANKIPENLDELKGSGNLTGALNFEFIPVEVLAKGRMSAGVVGVEPDQWVVTLGQDLFGGENGQAKMRPTQWDWVEYLQNLQREDLLKEIIQKKDNPTDTMAS